jgi:hypothetical protein
MSDVMDGKKEFENPVAEGEEDWPDGAVVSASPEQKVVLDADLGFISASAKQDDRLRADVRRLQEMQAAATLENSARAKDLAGKNQQISELRATIAAEKAKLVEEAQGQGEEIERDFETEGIHQSDNTIEDLDMGMAAALGYTYSARVLPMAC